MNTVIATQPQLASAFTEWDRRYREEPERFMSEAQRLLKETPATYGAACAPYLTQILNEQRGPIPTPPPIARRPLIAPNARFTKIGHSGEYLPPDAEEWVAVLDSRTLLTWSALHISNGKMSWKAAVDAAAKFKLLDSTDWRLPNIQELFSIADHARKDPAIDTTLFPDAQAAWYWSSSPLAANPEDYAWGVGFYSGNADYDGQYNDGFVRAVRSAAPGPSQ